MKKIGSKKTVIKIIWILFALLSVLIWIPQFDGLITKDYSEVSKYVDLDDAWDIMINDETWRNVLLADFHFPAVRKGDVITMQRTLPTDWGLVEGAMRFYVRHDAVRMYIDDEQIYEYGQDRLAAGKTVGSGYQYIKFPNEYQGKRLRIHLVMAEDKVFTKFDSVRLYEWENVYRVLLTENRLPLLCSSFLILFGLIVCVITTFALVYSIKYVRLFCISLFSICMGLWTLSYYNLMQVFAIPLYSISLINYLGLYLASIPLTVYIYEEAANIKYRPIKIFYTMFCVTDVTAVFVFILLHVLNIVHLPGTLKYMQCIMIIGLLFFLLVSVMNLKFPKIENRLSVLGLLIVIGCVTYDIFDYNSRRYFGTNCFTVQGVSAIGIVFFICILFISFYLEMTQKMLEQKERDYLIKSAYTDELTQLHNRRYCTEYMNKLKEEKGLEYTVICFDLNNLKIVNDTYGHAKGDVLIKSAADVIAKTFESYGIVARMGGDEFVAIIQTADETKLTSLMQQFVENIDQKNRTVQDLNMSIAYGYASGSQSNSDIEKVYQIADDNMYEKKKQMKAPLAE
ncbi:MAG: GGDEF domain-containing protein [Lachnospiraceae bacterium]|nr:GGDEF domain-containing protein [Lachnospiraceae bacterium]